MKKNNYKFFVYLLLIIITFFTKSYVAEARDCRYYTFDSYVKSNNIVLPSVHEYGKDYDMVKVGNAARHFNVTGKDVHFFNRYYGKSCYTKDCDTWRDSKDFYDEFWGFTFSSSIDTPCPAYVKVSGSGDKKEWEVSNQSEFLSYLKNPYKDAEETDIPGVYLSYFSNPWKHNDYVVFISEDNMYSYTYHKYDKIKDFSGRQHDDPRGEMLKDLAVGEDGNGMDVRLFEDFGNPGSTELDLYNASASTWEKIIDSTTSDLENKCGIKYENYKISDYVNQNSDRHITQGSEGDVTHSALLFTYDYEVTKDVSEDCENALLKHAYAHHVFSYWFKKVDLWSFEKSMDINNDSFKYTLKNNFRACFDGEHDCSDRDAFVNSYKITEEDKKNMNKIQFFKFYRFSGRRQIDKVVALLHIYSWYLYSTEKNACEDLSSINMDNVNKGSCEVEEETKTFTSCDSYAGYVIGKINKGSNASSDYSKYVKECEEKMENGEFTVTFNEQNEDSKNYCKCTSLYESCRNKKSSKDSINKCTKEGYEEYLREQGYSEEKIEEVITDMDTVIDESITDEISAISANKSSVNYNFGEIDSRYVSLTVDCEKLVVFRWIWRFIIYLAPFLLILFGSIDYMKVVTAGGEDAVRKAKGNFKIRLIAFVLLLIIPFVIRIILSSFDTSASESIEALKCIVNVK